ncbi:MAG TPA: hypothetical protein VGP89_09435 [Candidatus Angelobacter sp.]|nr:hypothetical protein [Candidatus Angelobacter sp.]
MSIILFTTRSLHPLAEELMVYGIAVHEALAISEVLALAEQHPEAQIVIMSDVDAARAQEIQQRYPTITLKADATARDVMFAGGPDSTIQ